MATITKEEREQKELQLRKKRREEAQARARPRPRPHARLYAHAYMQALLTKKEQIDPEEVARQQKKDAKRQGRDINMVNIVNVLEDDDAVMRREEAEAIRQRHLAARKKRMEAAAARRVDEAARRQAEEVQRSTEYSTGHGLGWVQDCVIWYKCLVQYTRGKVPDTATVQYWVHHWT